MSSKLFIHLAAKTALLMPLLMQGTTEAAQSPQPASTSIEVSVTELNPVQTSAPLVARNDNGDRDFDNDRDRDDNNQSRSEWRQDSNADFG